MADYILDVLTRRASLVYSPNVLSHANAYMNIHTLHYTVNDNSLQLNRVYSLTGKGNSDKIELNKYSSPDSSPNTFQVIVLPVHECLPRTTKYIAPRKV